MSSPVIRSTLRRGDTGTAIQDLQRKLGIHVDGSFGADTEHAVREFQAHHGLEVSGIVDEATNAKLFSELSEDAETLMRFREDE